MEQNLSTAFGSSAGSLELAASRHRVMRNVYWLLALSMLPTVAGAFLGVQLGLIRALVGSPIIAVVGFLAVSFGFFYAIEKTKNSGAGVFVLLGFTFFMGLWLSPLISHTLGFRNGPALIMIAFGGTAAVFGCMATVATVSKRDFSSMGKWLFAGVLVLLVCSLLNIWLQMPALYLAISVLAIGIFSAYLLYDVQQVINGGETNYITATLSIYLDVYNIFMNLLQLLGVLGGERD